MGPPDPIIGLNDAFKNDTNPNKVNVGVGAYRDDLGSPYVLPVVRKAESLVSSSGLDHEYAGIAGEQEFVDLAMEFAYGDDCVKIKEGKVKGVQTLSGTGGLRVMGEFLAKFGKHKHIYVPDPTWGNHIPIMQNCGLEVKKYRYYDAGNSGLDFSGLVEDMEKAPEGSCFLLHACAHNPTGMDPTESQWSEISKVIKEKGHFPFFDCAYQGFASGNAPKDAWSIRKFVSDGHELALVQSFSKNFGLYGQRVGCLSWVAGSEEEAKRVESQMKIVIRPSYSNPPRHGARIVATILRDEGMTKEFVDQCKGMADRIGGMRTALRSSLEDAGSTRDWSHVTSQIGMFAYSGLSKEQVERMRDEFSVYGTLDGRISMAGVTKGNVEYIAKAMHECTK
ncbi:hypothetical protein TrCOL_g6549 [Triparma columacea]|uniref:Aspartate aminotransferase n=1 Tax=Triparma columacea TaxID=722753 RepID=A0A9W7GHX8_9STRA|nr:hypothetical protein TrCOL_g6549 [Triparma columacea]